MKDKVTSSANIENKEAEVSFKAINKGLERTLDEIDIEEGLINPFAPTLLEIAKNERQTDELSEGHFLRYADKVNKSKKELEMHRLSI